MIPIPNLSPYVYIEPKPVSVLSDPLRLLCPLDLFQHRQRTTTMELLKTLHLETSQFFSNCIRPSSVARIALYSFGGITILLFTVYLWLWPFQYATLHFRNLPGGSTPISPIINLSLR